MKKFTLWSYVPGGPRVLAPAASPYPTLTCMTLARVPAPDHVHIGSPRLCKVLWSLYAYRLINNKYLSKGEEMQAGGQL